MKTGIALALILAVLGAMLVSGGAALAGSPSIPSRFSTSPAGIHPRLQAILAAAQPGEMVTVIVTMKEQADLSKIGGPDRPARLRGLIRALQALSESSQRPLRALLETRRAKGRLAGYLPFWVFNGLSVTAAPEVIRELAARADVQSLTTDSIDIVPAQQGSSPAEANLAAVEAPALWQLGWQGQGIVVASLDTGVDRNHPDLAGRYRGGTNSWFDPYGQHPDAPVDRNGHGTWVMGVMVGGDGSGSFIGAAPQAQWISAKVFDDSGAATATAVHRSFQWLLDPDGNPQTADTPHVVNNSWSYGYPGCDLEFQLDLQALRAAGILPVFAAGNYGPGSASSVSPANYPETFAVGAVDNDGALYAFSSRGPSACGESATTYPELVSPGVNVRTSDLYGLYYSATGTSIAAPHVSGILALLLSAFPQASADLLAAALSGSAVDLGPAGADDAYGNGRLSAQAAYNWLAERAATPTPLPTDTPTSLPTNTPTPLPTDTPTPLPTDTPTPLSTDTPTPLSTDTPTPLPTDTPTPTPTSTPASDVLFSDGFESGGWSAWSSATGGSNLAVTANAALRDQYGLQASIRSTTALYLRDASPLAEASYHARFYFHPNGVTMRNGKIHTLFAGRASGGTQLFRLQVRFASGGYQLRALARTNSGSEVTTSWYALTNAAHAIEIAWKAASTRTGTDGALSLWLDGALKETRAGISNGAYRLEEALLGPQNLPSGTAGLEYYDAFHSTRSSYIGP